MSDNEQTFLKNFTKTINKGLVVARAMLIFIEKQKALSDEAKRMLIDYTQLIITADEKVLAQIENLLHG